MKRTFDSLAQLRACTGEEVAVSDWLAVDQARIGAFADATDDHQWIHLDTARAARESPYGRTVAHGFLTLALVASFLTHGLDCKGVRLAVNYGVNRVRFPAPVPAGSRLRGRIELLEAKDLPDGWAQLVWKVTVELEQHDKPACVAELITRWQF